MPAKSKRRGSAIHNPSAKRAKKEKVLGAQVESDSNPLISQLGSPSSSAFSTRTIRTHVESLGTLCIRKLSQNYAAIYERDNESLKKWLRRLPPVLSGAVFRMISTDWPHTMDADFVLIVK
jgi:hypothetical protein